MGLVVDGVVGLRVSGIIICEVHNLPCPVSAVDLDGKMQGVESFLMITVDRSREERIQGILDKLADSAVASGLFGE